MEIQNHIVFFSGGIGSYITAKRVIEKYGSDNVTLLFTDTKIEDEDLYRFINEAVEKLKARFVSIEDGRDVWEVARDVKFLPNSRIAQCSHLLKQKPAKEYVFENYDPKNTVLYLGIDWTEEHRRKAPIKNWSPFRVEFPVCDTPFLSKEQMIEELEKDGIKVPRLYRMGFSHNNCGGFCFRAGIGHFNNLLKQMPERFKYHEKKEQEMRSFLGRDVSILRRTINGKVHNYTLKQLREENNIGQLEMFDIGGCGCFADEGGDCEQIL